MMLMESFEETRKRYLDTLRELILDHVYPDSEITPAVLVEMRDGKSGSISMHPEMFEGEGLEFVIQEMREHEVYRYGFYMNALATEYGLEDVISMDFDELTDLVEDSEEVISFSIVDPFNVELYIAPFYRKEDHVEMGEWIRSNPERDPLIVPLRSAITLQG